MENSKNLGCRDLFISRQPAFEKISGRYSECKANNFIPGNIMLFYEFFIDHTEADQFFAVPGGCTDIIFSCNGENPAAKVCGSATKGKKIYYKPGIEYFGIRLLPGYDIQFLNYPTREFVDKEIPLNEILAKDKDIIEKISSAEGFNNRINIIEDYLKGYFSNNAPSINLCSAIVNKVLKYNGQMRIENLACETGYSARYICKIFNESIGISPKLFSRIVRFQKCLDVMLNARVSSIDDIIFEYGFYDQSHFLKEFKEFCYLLPHQLSKI